MDIKVTIEASPELLTAINTLTATLVELVSLRAATHVLTASVGETAPGPIAPAEAQKPKKGTKKADKPTSNITLETVRAKLAELSQSGKQKEVKALINSFGVAKLTDIPEDKYPEVIEKAGEMEGLPF